MHGSYILLVEKDFMFLELTEANFHNDYKCINITGTGMISETNNSL